MKNPSRSLRRHHAARLMKARRFHWGLDLKYECRAWRAVVDTPTNCSCTLCGNPRKWFNQPTLHERRFNQRALHDE